MCLNPDHKNREVVDNKYIQILEYYHILIMGGYWIAFPGLR